MQAHTRARARRRERERERERKSSNAISFEPSPATASKVRHARKYACGAFRLTLYELTEALRRGAECARACSQVAHVTGRSDSRAHGFGTKGYCTKGLRAGTREEKNEEEGFGKGGGNTCRCETGGLFCEREIRSKPLPACLCRVPFMPSLSCSPCSYVRTLRCTTGCNR